MEGSAPLQWRGVHVNPVVNRVSSLGPPAPRAELAQPGSASPSLACAAVNVSLAAVNVSLAASATAVAMLRSTIVSLLVAHAHAHGAMSFPRPRQSLDGTLAPWTSWGFPCDSTHQGQECKIDFCDDDPSTCIGLCPISAHSGVKDQLDASNGQACFWFSNGCTIGCDHCDGTSNHVGHGGQSFLYKGMNQTEISDKNLSMGQDVWAPAPGEMVLDPASTKSLDIKPNCEHPTTNATICDPSLRTVNTQAECRSADDIYQYSPWRAPGSAPVIDACGSAGGRWPGQGKGGAGAQFYNSSLAKQGDMGSKLPQMPSQASWRAGEAVEVGWVVNANHGGGYAYRLAPADAPLTEETFRKLPLDFVGRSALRWDGDRAAQLEFDASRVATGTWPAGSMWSKNPIPLGLWGRVGPSFAPVCEESEACKAGFAHALGAPTGTCRCSGYSNVGPLLPNLEIVDEVRIPSHLAPGRYVLQFRWDCEESDQVWASCADVTIEAPATVES